VYRARAVQPARGRQARWRACAFTADLGHASLTVALAQVGRLADTTRAALRLEVALGLAANPLIAQLAAQLGGAGTGIVVPPGHEAAFLAPQSIRLLPIEQAIAERLGLFGLRTIGAVAQLPRDALEAQFGAAGGLLFDLARGVNQAPLWCYLYQWWIIPGSNRLSVLDSGNRAQIGSYQPCPLQSFSAVYSHFSALESHTARLCDRMNK
jgi:hypothetical protein